MTKNELLEQIEQKNAEISELHKEIEKLDRYKQYADGADEMKALYDSFIHAGFSEAEAFTLTVTMIKSAAVMMKPRLF